MSDKRPSKARSLSIMILDDRSTRKFGLTLRAGTFRLVGLAVCVWVVGTIFSCATYWIVAQKASRAEFLAMKNKHLEQENRRVAALAEELARMREINQRIRVIAGAQRRHAEEEIAVTSLEERASLEANELARAASLPEIPVQDEQSLGERAPELAPLLERLRSQLKSTPSLWPVSRGWITKGFHEKGAGFEGRHTGVDISARMGAPVRATADGVVVEAIWTNDLGNLVVIDHGYGFTTRYGHNSRLLVREGDIVRRGQLIALVGSSGCSSGPHLHYEVWRHGTCVDPRPFLK